MESRVWQGRFIRFKGCDRSCSLIPFVARCTTPRSSNGSKYRLLFGGRSVISE